ncbi:MAG: hypothetical protein DMD99_11365 [Candidatus Rokuibacteriota bacterium]|nr:MAG: hypothetical protein DMD99_11365 [Candidatus Rokubacteria bacterium]
MHRGDKLQERAEAKNLVTPAHRIDPLADPRWVEFVERHPRASVFHTPGWLEALRRTYGYEAVAYTTTPPGIELTNGVVLCRVYSRITGRRMVSLPFSDHCEPLVNRSEDLEGLLGSLETDCRREGWKYVEMRPRTTCALSPGGMEPVQYFYFHTVDLSLELEGIFRRFHKDSTQRKIRRAEREGLTYEEGRSEALLEKFYRLLVRTRQRHQWPPQPRDWFRNLVDCLGDKVKIRVASKDGRPIASILTLSFKDVLVFKYGGSDERFHNLGAVHLLLWNAIQDGKSNGVREFELGRSDSDNLGLVTFKERWGATRSQLTYWRYQTPTSTALSGWGIKLARNFFAHIPDRLLIAVGKMVYRHLG